MQKTEKEPKRILFVHSAGPQGGPGEGSFDLVAALETELSDGYDIQYPVIDNPEVPAYQSWKECLGSVFEKNTEPLILVGHSLGGSVLLKYLSEEEADISIAGLFLIAVPFWGKEGWEAAEFVLPGKFEAKFRHIPDVYFYHSKYDGIVPFEHLGFYRQAFPHATVRVLEGHDHAFMEGLPELVSDIKDM